MKKILLLSVFSCLAGLVVGQVSQTLDSVEFLLKSEKTHQADILLKRLEKIPNPTLNTRSKARILVNQARVNNANGNYTASLEFLIKAEHLLKKKHLEASLPLLYTTFGDLFYNLGAYDLSIEHYHTFLQYEHDETKRFYVFNRIGTIYYKQERYDEARKIFEEQYEISKHFSTELEQLSAYNNIALANMRKGNYEIAIGQFLKVINGLEKYGTRHKDFYTVVCNNVGYAYYWMRRYENAIPYFEKAKENNPNIPPDLLNLQKFLGECYLNTGQIKKAEKLESEIRKNYASMSTSAQINFNSFRHKLYTALGQSEKLSKLNLESEVLYETLMSEHKKRDNTTASIVTKYLIYASEEKLKEEKIAKENTARALVLKKREFNLVISILIIASLSIIIAIFLFRQRLKNKQSKAQIEKELLLLKEEKLKQQIEMQSRSLTDFAIEIKLKRKQYKESIDNLKEILHNEEDNLAQGIHSMISEMKRNNHSDKSVSEDNPETEVLLQRFKNQLLTSFPKLTKAEVELCSLLRLQLSNKEIAMYRGINQDSVKMAKRRMKRKLNLDAEQSLTAFIIGLDEVGE